jgi:hypothetical protein
MVRFNGIDQEAKGLETRAGYITALVAKHYQNRAAKPFASAIGIEGASLIGSGAVWMLDSK